MLNAYISQTQQLLQNPNAPKTLYSIPDIVGWVNIARGQLAGEAECIRRQGSLTLVASTRSYDFTAITVSPATGIGGVINVRQILLAIGNATPQGYRWIRPRGYEWFTLYQLNNPVPALGTPKVWSQYAQGAAPQTGFQASGGNLQFDPIPDTGYTIQADCVCYPAPLNGDTDPEAIPYLWTDAVPYFAAYLALLSAQSTARIADANRMKDLYELFVQRARQFANPSVVPYQSPQSGDPTRANKLGLQVARGGGG